MPKALFEIKHFQSGTVTTPDVKDIPDDAAVYSRNLDPVVEQGKLKGIPKDVTLKKYTQAGVTHSNGTQNDIRISPVEIAKFYEVSNSTDIIVKIVGVDQLGDSFIYSTDGGTTYSSSATCGALASQNTLSNGLVIYWLAITGHTVNEQWVLTTTSETVDAVRMGLLHNAGQRDLVYYDNTNNDFRKILRIFGTASTITSIGAATSSHNEVTMQAHNKELHVGTGGKGVSSDSENVPKWIGYPTHGQWGDDPPSNMIMENAELKPPAAIPLVHKTIIIGDYMYAIEWKGTKVYKYKHDDSTFVSSGGSFIQATAICKYDSTHILVFDQSTGTNGTVFKLTADELNGVSSHPLFDEYRDDTDSDIFSDMHITNIGGGDDARLWFSVYRSIGSFVTAERKILFNASVPTGSGTAITLVDRTWDNQVVSTMANATDIGNWSSAPSINTYRVCLSDAQDSDAVSMILDLNNKPIWTVYDGETSPVTTDTDTTGQTGIMVVKKDLTGSGVTSLILNTNTSKVKLFILTKYNDDTSHEERVVTSIYYTDRRYYVGYHGGTGAADGIFIVYNHATVASQWSYFRITDGEIPELDAEDYEWTHDNGSPTYAFRDTVSDVLTFRGFSTKNIGQLMTITFDLDADPDPAIVAETIQATNDVSLVTIANAKAGDIGEEDTTTYQKYKISYLYDEYQESPLSSEVANIEIDDEKYAIDLDIRIKTANLSKRISHINIYRVESVSSNPTAFYRLVKSIKLDGNWSDHDASAGVGLVIGVHKAYNYSDTGSLGASYDARTGISETMEKFTPHYGLSCELNSSMIIGNCWHYDLDDAEQYIFKSKGHKFDTFDWTMDFLKLPNKPTALAGFRGRVYAFDDNTTWKINTGGMYIEDTFEGAGCISSDSVVVTEYGMCFADKNNVYLHDGQNPVPIGVTIQGYADWVGGTDYSWLSGAFNSFKPKILFDSRRNSFVIFFKSNSSSNYFAWSYNLPRKRWDLWEVPNLPKSVLTGEDGKMILNAGTELMFYLGSSSDSRGWDYITKALSFGYDLLDKKIYEIKVSGDDINIEHLGATSGSGIKSLIIPLTDRRQKDMQIKLVGGETDEIDSLAVVYRHMPITSGNI